MTHDLDADLHVFGSYVTGHLPRAHPLVADTTHDDRALEGIWLGNELNTPNFLMWIFKHKKKTKINVLVKECFRAVLLKPVEGMRDRWAG
jgi:hypothetical protein